jgi:hypothetical protein
VRRVRLENDLDRFFEDASRWKGLRRDPLIEVMGMHAQILGELRAAALDGLHALEEPR